MTANVASLDVGRDPRTGTAHPGVPHTPPDQVASVLRTAGTAADAIATTSLRERSRWLETVASAMEDAAEQLVALADAETALGADRLRGELAKAAASVRLYAGVAAEGSFMQATIDRAGGDVPLDLRRARLPLGPVAVFGASNFPFGFGVAGHDTASALAAGCPVLVKAHPAHPRLSVLLGKLVTTALNECGAPAGAFALVVGFDAGLALVDAPEVTAVAFTGSQTGGIALVERAQRRPVPIPVFAEMGTVNPVVVTPAAARTRLREVAAGFVGSFTLGQGQFCTKPGLLLAPKGSGAAQLVANALKAAPPGWLLTAAIAEAYAQGVADLQESGAALVAQASPAAAGFAAAATVLVADAADLKPDSRLLAECFGPAALVVEYGDRDELRGVIGQLQPSLAGAVASAGPDDSDLPWLVHQLAGKAGRIVVDGWPTGVATTWAQQHGGPWPATSRPDATSVGAAALDRFTRPVAFQNTPEVALPPALQDANPWGLPRRLDGVLAARIGNAS